MNPPLACDDARDRIPDLALGSLGGEDRAVLVAHLSTCASCQELSDDLIRVVDDLLVLTPPAEPPEGFETRVLAAMTGAARPRAWHRPRAFDPPARWLAVAALILVFAAGGLAGVSLSGRRPAQAPSPQLAGLIREAPLVGGSGATWGDAYVHAGAEPWVFVSMHWDLPDSDLTVELAGPGIPTVDLSGLRLVNGQGAIGRGVGGDVRNVRTVRVLDHLGRELCRATLT